MMLSSTLSTIFFITSVLCAAPPPGFAPKTSSTNVASDSIQVDDSDPAVMNSTGAPPMNLTSQLNQAAGFPGLPSLPIPFLPGSGSSSSPLTGGLPGPPGFFPNPLPSVTPPVNNTCLARIAADSRMLSQESGRQPQPFDRFSCFSPYTKVPDGENLVVASVDAATNFTASLSKFVQDVSGKKFVAIIPIVIAEFRTLTAIVATGIAHIALATSKGLFTSSSLVYVLEGFVTAGQSVTEGLIGEKSFFAQFKALTPIRNSILSLKSVIDKFILLLIHMIPPNKSIMAANLHQKFNNSMDKVINAFDVTDG